MQGRTEENNDMEWITFPSSEYEQDLERNNAEYWFTCNL
jgi:hypothetical protein